MCGKVTDIMTALGLADDVMVPFFPGIQSSVNLISVFLNTIWSVIHFKSMFVQKERNQNHESSPLYPCCCFNMEPESNQHPKPGEKGMKQGDSGVGQRRSKARTVEPFQYGAHKAVAARSCESKYFRKNG
ncbi:hypothetical protein STEG23_038103, partial [Scotinomys teguina]